MAINPKELSASNLAALAALLSVANAALETVERIATLNMNTVRSSLKNSAQGTKKVLAAKTPQEAAEAQSAMVQPAIDSAVAYTQALQQVSEEARNELAKLVEAQFSAFQKSAGRLLEQATKGAPAGSEAFVSAMQDALSKANSAYDQVTAMTRQLAEAGQATAVAVSKAAKAPAKAPAKTAAKRAPAKK